MAVKSLKPARLAAVSPAELPVRAGTRPDAASLRRVADVAGQSLPPATPATGRRTVMINLKIGADLADAIAARAEKEGVTQKMLVCTALAQFGLPVDPLDLQDRTRRRLRGVS
jgi:hypothetical protein